MNARAFVGAMLRPHHRKYPKFSQVRLVATHRGNNARIFFFGKAMFGDDLGRDFGHGSRFNAQALLPLPLIRQPRRKQATTGIANEKGSLQIFGAQVSLNRAAIGDEFGAQDAGEQTT
jgi:hypothetical protein